MTKTTLYNNEKIRERIMSLRSLHKGPQLNPPRNGTPPAATELIRRLNEAIRRLQTDKKNLIAQLVEMEELRDENKRLKDAHEKIRSQNLRDGHVGMTNTQERRK